MDRKICLCLVVLASCALGASQAHAYQIMPSPTSDEPTASPMWSLQDLEKAVENLRQECAAQPGSPEIASAPAGDAAAVPVAATSRQPISAQCRVITTLVHFARLRLACDDGPDMWYTQGFFQDPTDHKTCRFRFNDMGAAAAGNEYAAMFVVVYHPADRELCESDIEAMIPTEWVKEQQQK